MKMKVNNSTKQVFKQSTLVVLAAAMSLTSCKDKEVAPKTEAGTESSIDKAFENGFVKGTIKGTRKDGTAFEEPFEYKVTTDQSFFEKVSPTEHTLSLSRSKGIAVEHNYLRMAISVTNRDQAGTAAKLSGGYLEFTKVLADRNLFFLRTGTNLSARTVTLPMSNTNNATYKLVDNGINYEYEYNSDLRQGYHVYKDTDGNKIYFSNSQTFDPNTGDYYFAFKHIVNSAGVKSTTSPVWGNVRMAYHESNTKIFVTATGTDLSETMQLPGDTQEITNFAYNATTGLVTFDYKININQYRAFDGSYNNDIDGYAANTTMHPLEIKGSVSATVLNGTVMRKSAQ